MDKSILESLKGLCPEIVDLMEAAKRGEISEASAMQGVLNIAQQNPELAKKIQAELIFRLSSLVPNAEHSAGLIQTGVGLPKLNPLYEAALIERAQFDGDIPEHRTGPIPQGVKPAVSVKSNARNPVLLGKMLKEASDAMGEDVQAHEKTRLNGAEEKLQIPDGALEKLQETAQAMIPADKDAALIVWGSSDTDHPAYRRGQVPAPVVMTPPSGAALARLSVEEQREYAWKFLSTTQGRRTALETLRDEISGELQKKGFQVTAGVGKPSGQVLVQHQWVVQMGGAGATQPAFSYLDTACRALSSTLIKGCPVPRAVYLYVYSVDTVNDREVGWGAGLVAYSKGKLIK